MKLWRRFGFLLLILLAGGCSREPEQEFYLYNEDFPFDTGTEGWEGDFADYLAEDSIVCELQVDHIQLPSELAQNKKALMLSGINKNKNLFMFIKKKLNGLKPSTEYTLAYDIELASNTPKSSGENFLKAGASAIEPVKYLSDDYFRLNIDKGYQSTGGKDMAVLGSISTNLNATSYTLLTLRSSSSMKVSTNSAGELWLTVGTDSSLQGVATVYYTRISVVLSISN